MHNGINKYPYEPQDPWTKVPKTNPWKNPWETPKDVSNNFKALDKAVKASIADVFPAIDRWGIGIIHDLETLRGIAQQKPSYPPYNIKKFEDGKWRIDMAVAGFRKDELAISVQERTLTVQSNFSESDLDRELRDAHVIHQGIAQRNFRVQFALAEYVEVDKAEYADGILTIKLVTNLPEEKKPKVIDIQ